MDTNLGVFELTDKQVTQLKELNSELITGFCYRQSSKEIFVVSSRALTAQEISDLKTAIAILPDAYSQDYYKAAFDLIKFQSDLSGLLPGLSNPNLRWEFAALNAYATNKDFSGMGTYLDMLVSVGAATQDDVNSVKAIITSQGIVI